MVRLAKLNSKESDLRHAQGTPPPAPPQQQQPTCSRRCLCPLQQAAGLVVQLVVLPEVRATAALEGSGQVLGHAAWWRWG